jgi:pimeloyl-ACP methyl ester carboxylesterase
MKPASFVLAATASLLGTGALAQAPNIVTEEMMVPASEAGIEIYVRNKRPAAMSAFRPERTVVFVHDDKKADLIPTGWFETWADATWATDPKSSESNPPLLRAPNGVLQDGADFWSAGKAYYDPAKVTVPALLVVAEWDRDTPPYMAQTLFPLLTNSPGKRLVLLAEGTHTIAMEKNRLKLFEAVQAFLDEAGRS